MKVALFIILGKLFSTLSLQVSLKSVVDYPNGTIVNQVQNVTIDYTKKVLEDANGTHPVESKDLLKRLNWLINTLNITSLLLDRGLGRSDGTNITLPNFNKSHNVERTNDDGFLYVKYAILKLSNFTSTPSPQQIAEEKLRKAKSRSERVKIAVFADSAYSD